MSRAATVSGATTVPTRNLLCALVLDGKVLVETMLVLCLVLVHRCFLLSSDFPCFGITKAYGHLLRNTSPQV